jgi:hypothetical protein
MMHENINIKFSNDSEIGGFFKNKVTGTGSCLMASLGISRNILSGYNI